MATAYTTVKINKDLAESIVRVGKEQTGFKPVLQDFVEVAVKEKLKSLTMTATNLVKLPIQKKSAVK